MNPRKQRTVTNGDWGVSGTSGSHIEGVIGNYYKHHPAPHRSPRYITQYGDHNGRTFDTHEERKAFELTHGYIQWYGRNTCQFRMSRRYRRYLKGQHRQTATQTGR